MKNGVLRGLAQTGGQMQIASEAKSGDRTTARETSSNSIRHNPPQVMSVPEAAIFLGLGARTLWTLIGEGKIKTRRLRGRRLILLRDLEAALEN